MSDAKKPGSRDISELKQRLGLKKGGAATTGQNARQNGASGGVVAPPGLNVPPPPSSGPQQPVIPNAADDPFGAMNAMAAVGAVQRAPEIVIVNDGRPVEHVGASRGTILRLAVPAVIALIVGLMIGIIGKSASFYNDGVAGAKVVLGDRNQPASYLGLRKTLSDLDTLLGEANTKNSLKPDSATTKALAAISKHLEISSDLVYKVRANVIDADTVASVVQFYGGIAELKGMLDTHIRLAANDDLAFTAGKKKADDATVKDSENALLANGIRYGVVVQAQGDQGGDFGARLVELGPPYCNNKMSTTGKCGEGELSGIGVRSDAGASWAQTELATPGDSAPAKKLLQILPNGVSSELVKGGESGAAELYYVKRMRAIVERTQKLLKDSDDDSTTTKSLKAAAGAKTKFSFFM